MARLRGLGTAVEESQDEFNYQQSAERKHASSYCSEAFNLGGGVDWKNKINDVMSKISAKVEGKGRCRRLLVACVKEWMLKYDLGKGKSC